jgi:hypothetical protein
MNRQLPWFWIILAGVLLAAPTPLGRLLLDLLGGLTLALLLLPLLLAGAGALAFQILRRRARTCTVCGLSSLSTTSCPACGSPLPNVKANGSASDPNSPAESVNQAGGEGLISVLLQRGSRSSDDPLSDGNLDVSDVTIDVESRDA